MSSELKILHVTPFFPPDKGGIANHVFNLCTNLAEKGNEIQIASPRPIISHLNDNSLRKFSFPSIYLPGWPYPTLRSVSIPVDFGRKLNSIIRKGRFDIVHVHGHHYPLSWMAINSAHKHNVPSVLTLHGMYALNPNVIGGKTKTEVLFNKYLFKNILSKTSAVIGLTKQITDYANSIGGESTNYYTIANGVDTLTYSSNLKRKNEYRSAYNIGGNSIVILFRGRLEHVKGILDFAKAVRNISNTVEANTEFVIVGEGTLETEVQKILDGLPKIRILPWQPLNRIHELYIVSDIFVIPSKFEALPITIIEAMNASLHIVYTPVGGMPDILQGYSHKTMLTNGSAKEIEDVLVQLIKNFSCTQDEDSMSYARRFDWKAIAAEVSILYSKIND